MPRTKSQNNVTSTPARRGRKPKAATPAAPQTAPRRRGRPPKSESQDFVKVAPHVDTNAEVISTRKVRNARVIEVENASYRGCTISGTLLMAEGKEPKVWRSGDIRVEVDFTWFDWSPQNSSPRIMVSEGNFEIKEKYTGSVIDAFGRPAKSE